VITLLTGEKLVVRESLDQVLELIHEFHIRSQRRIAPGYPADSRASEANLAPPEDPPMLDRPDKEKP